MHARGLRYRYCAHLPGNRRLPALVRKRPLVLQSLDVNELATDTPRFVGGDARRRHVTLPAKFATAEHERHAPETVGCVDCHMPERTYMVIDDRRDHSFRVPRPDLTERIGMPNACNACHADRDASWATATVAEWYGEDVFARELLAPECVERPWSVW